MVAGVDLTHPTALILRNLLILQFAKLTQLAKRAIPSYTFLTLHSSGRPPVSLPRLPLSRPRVSHHRQSRAFFPRNCFE